MSTVRHEQLESSQVYPDVFGFGVSSCIVDKEHERCGYCQEHNATRKDGCCDECRESIKELR